MNRKDFLKLSSLAGIGLPFYINGMPTKILNQFLDVTVANCDEVNDRVLVIVRLAGANDGLNTVIPVAQYDTYANLRPTIKISNSGANAYLPLDTTVSSSKRVGLHPVMTGFRSLYNSGKMTLLNGVGYPDPNYSHFRSEALIFAGKDGTYGGSLNSGIFGRYLAAKDPGLAGNPTTSRPDPLAIQLGDLNPNLFYEHANERSIEYNLTGFQNSVFFPGVGKSAASYDTEHEDLLVYIRGVLSSMDKYYTRVTQVFNAGSNSSVSYPNSSLAKQLKTVARLIKGGSKTKIFQVNLMGFDTHNGQVQSGNTHLGTHANLLSDLSNSITAFQNDITALGLADKILTVSMSEFGRQVRENGNFGTDHGDIAPFFVIGSNVAAGILGDHPVFSNTTSYYYDSAQRRFDYRQIYGALLKDWLGADTSLMAASELNQYVQSNLKLNLVTPSKVASAVCGPTLDTSTAEVKKQISIYPNPAHDHFKISVENAGSNAPIEINIYDMSGKHVMKEMSNAVSPTTISTLKLTNGIYIVHVKTEKGLFSEKLIVKK